MQTPTSQPPAARASSKRLAYGAPEAPVMPRKTRNVAKAYAQRPRRARPRPQWLAPPLEALRKAPSCSSWAEVTEPP
jgi:hypothetical protein